MAKKAYTEEELALIRAQQAKRSREWRRKNPERAREIQLNYLLRKALAEGGGAQ